ncbi:MAG: GAF domain-containing protein [Anaerolineae bacterium]
MQSAVGASRQVQTLDDIRALRETLMRSILRVLLVGGGLGVLGASYYAYVQNELYYIPIYAALFALISVVALWRRVPYTFQVYFIIGLLYALALLNFATEGRGSLGRVFLYAMAFTAVIFVGRRAILPTIAVVVLTMAGFAWAFASGNMAGSGYQEVSSTLPAGWISNTIILLALISLVVLSVNFIVTRLTASLDQSRKLTAELKQQQAGLEEQVAARTAALAERTDTLQRSTNYLTALQDTAVDLVSLFDVNQLLQAMITRAGALVDTEHGYVFLLDAQTGQMEMRVGTGTYAGLVGTRALAGSGLAGTVWQTGAPVVADDYQNWAGRLGGSARSQLRTVVGVPLTSGNETIGVIGLAYTDAGRKFGAEAVDVVARFAQLASIALQNAQLYAEERALVEENRQATRRAEALAEENRHSAERAAALAEENQRLLERSQRAIQELNEVTRRLTREGWDEVLLRSQGSILIQDAASGGAAASPELAAMDEAVEKGELVKSRAGGCNAMAVPIVVRGEVIGSIALEDQDTSPEWDADETVAIQDVAEHVALAIENARLYEQTQAALAETRRLAERQAQISVIGERLYASTDVQAVLQKAAEELVQLTGRGRAVAWVPRKNTEAERVI